MAIQDPDVAEKIRKDRAQAGLDKHDEVWDGVTIVMPLPDNEHQELVGGLMVVADAVYGWPNPHRIRPGINLNDRVKDWKKNFREPDFVIYLEGNPAWNYGTHWVGGPDFLVEVVSPNDRARDKLDFYAKLETKEVLLVDRDPWRLELYHLRRGKLRRAGEAEPGDGNSLGSRVLPVSFSLVDGEPRPRIHVVHATTDQEWDI